MKPCDSEAESLEMPELGTVRLGEECPHGVRAYSYLTPEGEELRGYAQRRQPGSRSVPAGDYEMTYGRDYASFSVARPLARPSRVSTPRYRRGWDETFGRHQGKSS